jgi:multiple sugar transport system permease protein
VSVDVPTRSPEAAAGEAGAAPSLQGTRHRFGSIVGLALFLLFVIAFGAYPLLQVVRMAFSTVEIEGQVFSWSWSGFENFRTVLGEAAAWNAVTNTMVFVLAATAGTVVLGLMLALLVDRAVALLPIARNVLIWPAIIAPVIVSLMWLLLLSPTAGGINQVLGTLGLPQQQWLDSETGAMVSVIVVDLWHWTPVVFLFLYAALQPIDSAILEAARIDGASEWQILRHVVIPLLAPAIGAVAVVRVVMGVKAFDEMYMLTSGGPRGATTLVSQHIRDLFFVSLRFGHASAYGLVIVVVTAVAVGMVMFVRSRQEAAR